MYIFGCLLLALHVLVVFMNIADDKRTGGQRLGNVIVNSLVVFYIGYTLYYFL